MNAHTKTFLTTDCIAVIATLFIPFQDENCPIHLAAHNGHCDIIRALVKEYGVDQASRGKVCL